MESQSEHPEAELRAEIEALRAEVAALRAEMVRAAEAPAVALDHAFGRRSMLGLRRFGTLLYFLLSPIYVVAWLARTLIWPERRYSLWENFYAASFTWVYLAGKEKSFTARLSRFFHEFARIRAQLRQA